MTKIYLEFMSYTLELLTDFNKIFQGESPLLHRVKPEVEQLLKVLCSNFMEVSQVRNKDVFSIDHCDERLFVDIKKIYLGVSATSTLQTLINAKDFSQKEYMIFLKSCLNFYVELVSEIKKRFVFNDPIFEIIKIVDPQTAQSFTEKSLEHVLQAFPVLKNFVEAQQLDNEWRKHAFLEYATLGIDCSKPAEQYWKQIFDLKNSAGVCLFQSLKIIITFLLVLPFSNSSVERVFSNLFNIKTDHRNKLGADTLAALLHTKRLIDNNCGGIIKFEPSNSTVNNNIWCSEREK